MGIKDVADKIENAIKCGNFPEVRKIVDDIVDINVIRSIEDAFPDRDPVVCAIHWREETIALYLVEKGFNHRRVYNYPGMQCDEWCYYDHQDDPCPTQYDALDVASKKHLHKIHNVIKNIRSGLRMPGDGLALMQNPEYKREDSSMSNRVRGVSAEMKNANTMGGLARRKIKDLGLRYLSKNGESVIHMCDSASMVHVCANMGVAINAPNFDGDTALHLAVRKGQREVCQALLMNGADPNQKNKLGQTPWDQTDGNTRDILEKFRPGFLQVVSRGEYNSIQRLIRLWCNPHSKISRDGKSAMEIVESLRANSEQNTRTYSLLAAHCKTLEVTHAVLSEDIPTLKRILRKEKGWSLNKRFKGGIGETLASCAVDQHNLEVLQLLVETGKCNLNMRVREMDEPGCNVCVPILFKTLEEDCPEEIWSYVDAEVDVFQTREKDVLGNTAILRAVMKGRSAKFIHRFIRRHPTTCLTERNKDGLNLRELAKEVKRLDIVETIDNFIVSRASFSFLAQFPVAFYGQENLPVSEEVQSQMPREKYKFLEDVGTALHEAASRGNLKAVSECNHADYKDKNGYTALIRAIVNNQYKVAELLITERPTLKSIPDNCNRYPLHYAYALPEEKGEAFVKLLLARNPADIEFKVDKDGREAVEYQDLQDIEEVQQMIRDVLTLDTKGERIVHGGLTNTPVSQHTEDIDLIGQDDCE